MCKRKKKIREYWYGLGYKRCHYCCIQLNYTSGFRNSATIEHLVPHSMGGTLARKNCLVVCSTCNRRRQDTPLERFVRGLPRECWLLQKYEEAKAYYSGR